MVRSGFWLQCLNNMKHPRQLQLISRAPEGDLQVLAFRLAQRTLEIAESRTGLAGLAKDLLPVIHNEVLQFVPRLKVPETVLSLVKKYAPENGNGNGEIA